MPWPITISATRSETRRLDKRVRQVLRTSWSTKLGSATLRGSSPRVRAIALQSAQQVPVQPLFRLAEAIDGLSAERGREQVIADRWAGFNCAKSFGLPLGSTTGTTVAEPLDLVANFLRQND